MKWHMMRVSVWQVQHSKMKPTSEACTKKNCNTWPWDATHILRTCLSPSPFSALPAIYIHRYWDHMMKSCVTFRKHRNTRQRGLEFFTSLLFLSPGPFPLPYFLHCHFHFFSPTHYFSPTHPLLQIVLVMTEIEEAPWVTHWLPPLVLCPEVLAVIYDCRLFFPHTLSCLLSIYISCLSHCKCSTWKEPLNTH